MVMTDAVGATLHGCAVLSSAEQGWEALTGFITDGIERQEQVVLAGLRADQVADLVRRLRDEEGVDPDPAMVDGQLVVMDEAVSRGFFGLPPKDFADQLTGQVEQAVRDGYPGVRLSGLYPAVGVAPHELALDGLVRAVPLTVLCPYFRHDLTSREVEQVRALHGSEVTDIAVYDDGSLRITQPRVGWVRLAGRWDATNHAAALSVVADAAAAGHRDLDLVSLRSIDPAGVYALLTGISGGLRLRRPNQLVQRLAGFIATQRRPTPDTPGT